MSPKRYRPKDAWERWSYSKLRAFLECPYNAALAYIDRVPAPLPTVNAFGIAAHYLFKRFFAVRFKSDVSFAGMWTGFWMKVMNGECGPEKFGSPPQEIAWASDGEGWYWHHKGVEAMKQFFAVHEDLRGTGIALKTEHRFQVRFSGLTVSGIIDRIDAEGSVRMPQAAVVDYKPGRLPKYQTWMLQFRFYQLAYELIRHRIPGQLPLSRMRIYSYLPGEYGKDLPLGRTEDLENLRQLLTEASWYVWSVQHKQPHPMLTLFPLRHFPYQDIERGTFSPKLPRGLHCTYCTYVDQCRQWELGNDRHSAHTVYVERLLAAAKARNLTQVPIPIFPDSPLP